LVTVLCMLAAGILVAAGSSFAAEPYPVKPIRVVIPFPAGGPTDVAARIIAPVLVQSLGQNIVIDNRGGSHGSIGAQIVAKARADGHTLLIGNSSPMIAVPVLRKTPPYDSVRDFSPVAFLGWTPLLLVVTPDIPVRSITELIDHARAIPGKIKVAAANPPTIFAMAQLRSLAKLDIVNVTYPIDAAALAALLAGEAHVMAAGMNIALAQVQAGKLRPLATLSANRAKVAPGIPTLAEAGLPRFAINPWVGMFAPAGTPATIIERLSREIDAAFRHPEIQAQLDRAAFDYKSSTPQELAKIVTDELAVWREVAREAGIEPH
jgi:tripartite-type tricarboxylate transporter receptor subunit TctC